MTKTQVLKIAILTDRVWSVSGPERAVVCARDCMLQWRYGGKELLEETLSAWDTFCKNEGKTNCETQRFGYYVPAIPL